MININESTLVIVYPQMIFVHVRIFPTLRRTIPFVVDDVLAYSIGGVFSVPVAVCTSEECIAFLKERQIKILTAQLQDSYEYYDYDMRPATAIVMGTESTGLTQQWRKAADAHIRIPMLGRLDSLNVSVSAAILMYEAVRQRKGEEVKSEK